MTPSTSQLVASWTTLHLPLSLVPHMHIDIVFPAQHNWYSRTVYPSQVSTETKRNPIIVAGYMKTSIGTKFFAGSLAL